MADYTREQLLKALRKADAAGDTEAARAIAKRLKGSLSASANGTAGVGETTLDGDARPTSFWRGVQEGAANVATNWLSLQESIGIGAPLTAGRKVGEWVSGSEPGRTIGGRIQTRLDEISDEAETRGSFGGKLAGGVVASIPMMAVPGGPFLQSALTGPLFADDPEDPASVAQSVVISGLAGKAGDMGGRVIGRGLGQVYNATTRQSARQASLRGDEVARAASLSGDDALSSAVRSGAAAQATAKGQPSPNALLARFIPGKRNVAVGLANNIPATGQNVLDPLGRKSVARAARFDSVGVKNPTTGMVTRNPSAWTTEKNLSKLEGVGDDLQTQMLSVQDDLTKAGRQLIDKSGGRIGAEPVGTRVKDALTQRKKDLQAGVNALYTRVRNERGNVDVGQLPTLRERLSSPDIVDNAGFDLARESMRRSLVTAGMMTKKGKWKLDGVTVSKAEELRKVAGRLSVGGATPAEARRMRTMLQKAIDDDVVAAVGDDAFKAARSAAQERFDEFLKTFPGQIVDEGIPPEQLGKRLLTATTSLDDLRTLRTSLEASPGGAEALTAMRGQLVADTLLGPDARPFMHEGAVNGGAIFRAFQGKADKLRILLPKSEYKALGRFARAARDATATVPNSSANVSGTTPMLANLMQRVTGNGERGAINRLFRSVVSFLPGGSKIAFGADVIESLGRTAKQGAVNKRLQAQAALAASPKAAAQAIRAAENKASKAAAVAARKQAAAAVRKKAADAASIPGRAVAVPASNLLDE